MVRHTAILVTGRDRCPECDATAAQMAADPMARAMRQWADVVLTATDCDHAPADDDTPRAAARFVPPNSLVVDTCPYCRGRHVHGAGAPTLGEQPDPNMYGSRSAHCHRGAYRLIPAREQA